MQKDTNTELVISWEVDGNTYEQKVALSIASGDIPDVMIVQRNSFFQMVESDYLEDMTDAFYNHLDSKLRQEYDTFEGILLPHATVGGKLLGIPGTNIGGGHNLLWVRMDWLEKANLEAPKTIDDITAIAKAFVDMDPGGNGTGETVGLTCSKTVYGAYNSLHGMDTIFSLYGAYPRLWITDASGQISYGSIADEVKPGLEKVRSMYSEGLIDKQFAVRDSAEELLAGGKCGMFFGAWWMPYWPLMDSVSNDPKADWKPFPAPLDQDGKLRVYSQDPVNGIVVVKKGFSNPQKVVEVINSEYNVLRKRTKEGGEIMDNYDRIGTSWTVIPIPYQIDSNDATLTCFNEIVEAINTGSDAKMRDDYKPMYADYIKNKENPGADAAAWATAVSRYEGQMYTFNPILSVKNPAFFGTTETMETKGANLKSLEDETIIKIIMGEADMSAFETFVTQWRQQGGDEITAEVRAVPR